LIKQTLNWDPWPDLWDQKKTTVVNVHVVSLQRYKAITGDDGGVEGAILHDESRSWPLRDRSGPKEGFWCMRDDPLAVASNKDAEKGW
jgi:ribosomal protein S1